MENNSFFHSPPTENDKIVVRIFDSYFTSEHYKKVYEESDSLFTSENSRISITSNEDYTHAIIINLAKPDLNIKKENVLGLGLEPTPFLNFDEEFIEYAKNHIGKYYIGQLPINLTLYSKPLTSNESAPQNNDSQLKDLQSTTKVDCSNEGDGLEITPLKPLQEIDVSRDRNMIINVVNTIFKQHYMYMNHNKPNYSLSKPKIMSLIISEKLWTNGHIYRHIIANEILNTDLPIDIYGRGCFIHKISELRSNEDINMVDDRIKGIFECEEPYLDYKFHICIENFQLDDYFSEKIINPLVTNTIPIYLGCKNIKKYFPDVVNPLQEPNFNGLTETNSESKVNSPECNEGELEILQSEVKENAESGEGKMIYMLTGNIEDDMKLLRDICEKPEYYEKMIHKDLDHVKEKVSLYRELERLFL
jgi:hypothetical protein